jgi:predicted methyltransferase
MRKLALGLLVVLVACSGHRPPAPTAADDYRAIVAAPDRTDGDRALDAGRHPAALLAFAGIRPGMRVAELMAGGGYTTELLARAVAPDGRVWAQNNRLILDRFAATPWSQRLARPALRDVVRVDRELEDPLPPDAHDLDVVVMVLFYHDTVWMGVDRDRMNRAVYAHLRPGGLYVIVDHSGRPGTGTSEVKTLHRIDEATVRAELERAGFRLARTTDFLRNPDDPRDWNDSPSAAGARRGTSDRFVLAYERPR